MPDRIPLPKLTIIYKDPFQFKTLYFFLHEWLMENGYRDPTGGDRLFEINYEEQRTGETNNYRIWWRTSRTPRGSKFLKYHINIDYLGLVIKKVDIMFEGKKKTADQGELTLWLTTFVEVDWNDYFKDHPILKYFEEWYKRRWMKAELEGHKMEMLRDQQKLQGAIKKYFEMWHYMPSEEIYHKKHEDT